MATKALANVQEALEQAHSTSTKAGKWSSVPNVKKFDSATTLSRLRELVKEGAAKEKITQGVATKLFKPTRASAGQGELVPDGKSSRRKPGDKGKRPGRPTGRHKSPGRRRGGEKTPENNWGKPKGPRRGTRVTGRKGDRRTQGNLRNVVGAGISTMLIGGMGSGMSGGASAPTASMRSVSVM